MSKQRNVSNLTFDTTIEDKYSICGVLDSLRKTNFGGYYCGNAMLRMPNWTERGLTREQWVQIPQSETDRRLFE